MNFQKTKGWLMVVTRDFLTYNRTEQRGIFVLFLVLLGLILVNWALPSGTLQKPPDYSDFMNEIIAFEAAWKKAADSDSIVRVQKYQNYRTGFQSHKNDTMRSGAKTNPILIVELNSADTFELQQLRGIGPSFARRIVNYRERLGGFFNRRQLLEVFGMDSSRFRAIESNLKVNPDSIHPMEINTITFKEMLRHPYFPFQITKNIMIYRKTRKNFKTLEELKQIDGVSDSLFRRMITYLRIGP